MAQGVDGVEPGGLARREEAEYHANRRREQKGDQHNPRIEDKRHPQLETRRAKRSYTQDACVS